MKDRQKLIQKINKLLIDYFGIPERAAKLPDPVDLLIATILSQNTNDNNSYRAFQNLRSAYPDWRKAAKANRSEIEKFIKVAGLGRQKSEAIKNFLTRITEQRGRISLDYVRELNDDQVINELTAFKGIGVKTASCVLLFALDKNVCPVDTHVHRTVNRIGIVKGNTPDKTFFALNENFPAGIAHPFHTNLIKLGREICLPNNPACRICPLEKLCAYENKNSDNGKSSGRKSFMLLDNIKSAD